jgi:hypothetical protein
MDKALSEDTEPTITLEPFHATLCGFSGSCLSRGNSCRRVAAAGQQISLVHRHGQLYCTKPSGCLDRHGLRIAFKQARRSIGMQAVILFVEDDRSSRRNISLFLRCSGYEVYEAENAEVAIDLLSSRILI